MTTFRLPRWVDVLFVVALGVYVLAGVPIATFHGDEPMQIYMSSDYATLFIDRAPERLITQPPYPIDSDQHLRILNGTVNRYTIGLAWQWAGFSVSDLPPRPGWDWGLSYADNVSTHHRPSEAQMNAARLPSALFFAASIGVLFLLTEQVGGRGAAYLATLLYTLHPALLLNGRRALQEGSMLFFGLLTLYTTVRILVIRYGSQFTVHSSQSNPVLPHATSKTDNSEPRTQNSELIWALLTLACGLTLASKHSGVVFVVGAVGGLIAFGVYVLGSQFTVHSPQSDTLLSRRTQDPEPRTQNREQLRYFLRILRTVVLTLALFYALSPALWNDPLARFGDLLAVRSELLGIQAAVSGGGMTFPQRIEQIIVQPFIAPLAHFETGAFAEAAPIAEEVVRYMESPLSGVQFGIIGGVLPTLLALVGISRSVLAVYPHPLTLSPSWRGGITTTPPAAIILLAALLVVLASLLANPLPWQRYYLPLMALTSIFAGVGGAVVVELFRKLYTRENISKRQ